MKKNENKLSKILCLGVFHFNFPNLDFQQISDSDKIDVFEKKHHDEIIQIVEKIADFKPTAIAIEYPSQNQDELNKTYNKYLNNEYKLTRDEHEQIGFRLAKKMNLETLYCVDEWGDFDSDINNLISNKDKTELNQFTSYMESNPDKDKYFEFEHVFKQEGILAELKKLNNPSNIKKSLGNYLINAFKYESQEKDFLGVKFETGRWFSRNLKIFRNIQRIPQESSERILLIFGADHLNLLNVLFDSSSEFELLSLNDYL